MKALLNMQKKLSNESGLNYRFCFIGIFCIELNTKTITSETSVKFPVRRSVVDAEVRHSVFRYVAAKSKALALHIQREKDTYNCVFFSVSTLASKTK